MPTSKYIYIIIVFIGFWSFNKPISAQDAPISQYYYNLYALNPAFCGTTGKARANMFYRDQWPLTNAGFRTFGFSYDMALPGIGSGFGVMFSSEQYAALLIPSIDLTYSKITKIAHNFTLSTALQAGVTQKFYSISALDFETDGENLSKGMNRFYPDFALGVNAFYNNIYAGIAVDHIAKPYQGLQKTGGDRLPRKYTVHVGWIKELETIMVKEERFFSPNLLFQLQGGQKTVNWGFNYQLNYLIGGVWLRHNIQPSFDALIFSLGFKTSDMRFAYSYDMNIGKKTTLPLGAHEISLTKTFEINVKKKYKPLKCPSFLE